jgi:hypothetical protein
MSYSAIAVFLWVMIGTTFVADNKKKQTLPDRIEMSLQQLTKGELTHVLWQGKKVSILYRNDTSDTSYLVYYDLGDSGNCPLFFNGKILKDTCTGTKYHQTGESVNQSKVDDLASPPHYFITLKNKVIIGTQKPII